MTDAPNHPAFFRIAVTFLQPWFHGRAGSNSDSPAEWPPSPLRLYSALIAASAVRWGDDLAAAASALRWLALSPPEVIVAPFAENAAPYVLSVPNNAMDKVAAAWARGNYSGEGDANPATHRTMKNIRPVRIRGGDTERTVSYLWPITNPPADDIRGHIQTLTAAGRCIVALGWGVDCAIGDAGIVSVAEAAALSGERWRPGAVGAPGLRIPIPGTLDDLIRRHHDFRKRITSDGFTPVPPLRAFTTAAYQRESDLPLRPFAAFILRPVDSDAEFASIPPEKANHLAANLRHAACRAALADRDPTTWRTDDWSLRFVAGHGPSGTPKRRAADDAHPRFSYLPIPSIGHPHADGLIRRAVIAEPPGSDGHSAAWAAIRLNGAILEAEGRGPIARLETVSPDEPEFARVFRLYAARAATEAATQWASVTPVILPGFDDNKAEKRLRLLENCLKHAGVPLAAVKELESRPPSWHHAAHAPHPAFARPDYLRHLPACHVRVRFRTPFRGPLSLGAGRHAGLGVMAAYESSPNIRRPRKDGAAF